MKRIAPIFALCLIHAAHTTPLRCPPVNWIKKAQFIEAIQNPYDATQWNVRSAYQDWHNQTWQVEFGSFFPEAHDEEAAIQMAQPAFEQSEANIKMPIPVSIPNCWLCEYTSTGGQYWISAQMPRQNT